MNQPLCASVELGQKTVTGNVNLNCMHSFGWKGKQRASHDRSFMGCFVATAAFCLLIKVVFTPQILMSSKEVEILLGLILALGNYMNGGKAVGCGWRIILIRFVYELV